MKCIWLVILLVLLGCGSKAIHKKVVDTNEVYEVFQNDTSKDAGIYLDITTKSPKEPNVIIRYGYGGAIGIPKYDNEEVIGTNPADNILTFVNVYSPTTGKTYKITASPEWNEVIKQDRIRDPQLKVFKYYAWGSHESVNYLFFHRRIIAQNSSVDYMPIQTMP